MRGRSSPRNDLPRVQDRRSSGTIRRENGPNGRDVSIRAGREVRADEGGVLFTARLGPFHAGVVELVGIEPGVTPGTETLVEDVLEARDRCRVKTIEHALELENDALVISRVEVAGIGSESLLERAALLLDAHRVELERTVYERSVREGRECPSDGRRWTWPPEVRSPSS